MTAPHPLLGQLKTERLARGLRQCDAADRAGLCARSIGYWETGTRQPTLDGLDLYARALGFRIIAVPLDTNDTADTAEDDPGDQLPYGELVIGTGEAWCHGCHQARSLRDFDKDKSKKNGRRSRCKHCRKDLAEQREWARYRRLASRGEGAA